MTSATALGFQRSDATLAAESNGGGLWNVQRVDHISDWTDSSSIKTYPNPLSQKEKALSSWFNGLNNAVAAKVNINALETIDNNCLLPDDYFENCTNGDKEEDCKAWSECQGLCSSWTACQ